MQYRISTPVQCPHLSVAARAFSLYTACSLRSVITISHASLYLWNFHGRVVTPAAWPACVIKRGGPSAFHAAQTVVFRHTGHHINSAQLVFEAIHDLGAKCMRIVLIKHNPGSLLPCAMPRTMGIPVFYLLSTHPL